MLFKKLLFLLLFCITPAYGTIEVSPITGGSVTPLTDAASVTWEANRGPAYSVTLGGNRAFANPSGLVAGSLYMLTVVQDATGTRVPTWGTSYQFPLATAPTLTTYAGAKDILFWYSDGTYLYLNSIAKDFSQALGAPTNLTATTTLRERINLTWTDNSTEETGFNIEVANEFAGWDTLGMAPANATSFELVEGAGDYTIRVKAVHNATLTAASNTAVGTSLVGTITAPSNLVGSTNQVGHVTLTWTDNSNNETAFVVDASTDGLTWYHCGGTNGANITTAICSEISSTPVSFFTPGVSYQFRLRASNTGNTVFSAPALGTGTAL